ncbi:MAG: prolyl-tRNA synthetase associated domain-containing protein [Spirochaetes bacterium]|nr:prolyl-tRNA synthetase associated domain-containing protein [Spirochaetota bacterium]MBL7006594.1 prolyl-tRNA synthetase associated domain-containing protein [Spirochaetia bacterium]
MHSVESYLKDHHIDYILHEHPAVFTCVEAEKYCSHIPGLPCKNLFLRNEKKRAYYLCILPAFKRADLKQIAAIVGEKSISFANARKLDEFLCLTPGAVSPFGLINDTAHSVHVLVDRDVWEADIVSFHPNRNTASLELTGEMFRKFLKSRDNIQKVIDIS